MASIKYKTNDGYVSIPMSIEAKTNEENGNGIGTCSTSSGTALTVSLTGYELVQNGFVAVTFANDVPAGATLNINGKGAKPIIYKGSAITADTIKADDTVMFAYDGTNYVVTSLGGGGAESNSLIHGYIVLDQTSSDPTTKVLDEYGNGYANYQRPNVITAIRNASHRYVGTFSNGKMSLKQLSDTNGTMYTDGTSAATDIATQGKDVFMRLPYFFTRATEVEADKWKIEFAFDEEQTLTKTSIPTGDNWKQWGGDLIGVYEAYCSNNGDNADGGLYSRSGVESGYASNQNFKIKARNRGNGFTLVKWKHQNIIAILFYAYYGNTDCQSICGYGSNAYTTITGLKNSLGMTDTTSSNGNTDSVNFWGLENWWGNKWQAVDNVLVVDGIWNITEDDNTVRTPSNTFATFNSAFYPSKFIIGDYLDIIPSFGNSEGTSSTGYCDWVWVDSSSSGVTIMTSYLRNNADGGVAAINGRGTSTSYWDNLGSRLAFSGTIEIV